MLEMIMDRHLQFVMLGAVASIGLISKIITGVTLKKLVWAAANMGKSTHPLMRLIRAKYEHACMVSDRVQKIRKGDGVDLCGNRCIVSIGRICASWNE